MWNRRCLIIASISSWTNMNIVNQNIAHFDGWKCMLLGNVDRDDYPKHRCEVIVHLNTFWGEILRLASNKISALGCKKNMLLLDDVDLRNLSVQRLIRFQHQHRADIVSPLVKKATHPFMKDTISQNASVPFVEVYSALFGKRAWKYFQRMLLHIPETGIGWGYDACLGKFFKSMVDRTQIVHHMNHRSISKFTGRATLEEAIILKWCTDHPPQQR